MQSKSALHRVTRARTALLLTQPFWGILSQTMQPVEVSRDEWIALFKGTNFSPTMATDGKHLFYHADFVNALPEPELIGVTAHEVSHKSKCHHTRRGKRDPRQWNIAADYNVNLDLKDGGFRLPPDALIDEKYRGMSTEQIYASRAKDEEKRQKEEQGQGAGAGSSSPGQPNGQGQPGPAGEPYKGFGEVLDAAPENDKAELADIEAETQAQVRQAAMIAKAQGAGKFPGCVAEIIAELSKPVIDWREMLRRFADDSSVKDASWSKPNRRYMGTGLIFPSMVSIAPAHVVFVIDTSGSMSTKALIACGAEIQSALDDNAVDRVTIVYCDTRVHSSASYESGDMIAFNCQGRGGTAFAPAFAWIKEHCQDASAIVYLTDLDCQDFGPEPAAPVLWACTSDKTFAPFGEVLKVDPYG